MGDLLVRASIRGAGRSASRFTAAQREVQDAIVAELRGIGRFAESAYSRAAPRDLSTMANTIRAVPSFRATRPKVQVTVSAVRDGFNYLTATRKGQRAAIIRPVRARYMTVYAQGRRSGKYVLRRQVRASRPAVDWVEEASLEVGGELNNAEDRIGRRIESRFA